MIGTKIRKARVALYLSQENLVEELGITQASLSRIESDLQVPGLMLLHQISRHLSLKWHQTCQIALFHILRILTTINREKHLYCHKFLFFENKFNRDQS